MSTTEEKDQQQQQQQYQPPTISGNNQTNSSQEDKEEDDKISNFNAFTGNNDRNVAQNYLAMTNGDFSAAVSEYLDDKDVGENNNGENNNNVGYVSPSSMDPPGHPTSEPAKNNAGNNTSEPVKNAKIIQKFFQTTVKPKQRQQQEEDSKERQTIQP